MKHTTTYLFLILTFHLQAQSIENTYSEEGRVTQRTYSNGVIETWQFNEVGQVEVYQLSTMSAPNLEASGTIPQSLLELGGSIAITYTSENIATDTQAGAGSHYVRIWLSADDVIDGIPIDKPLHSEYISNLAPGEAYTATEVVQIPPGFAEGAAYIIIHTDANGQIAEVMESDNIYPIAVSLYACVLDVTLTDTPDSCAEGIGEIIADVQNGTDDLTYQWSNGSTDASISGITNGEYSLTVTDTNGCTAIENTYINDIPDTPLEAVFVLNSDHTVGTVYASGGTPDYTYLWIPDDHTGQTQAVEEGESYTIRVTDENGCEEEIQTGIIELIYTNITHVNGAFSINVFPNPSKGIVNFTAEKALNRLHILDAKGVIHHKTTLNLPANTPHQINIRHLSSGIYHLQFFDDNEKTAVVRLVLRK